MTKTVSTQDPTAPRRELYPPIEPYDIGRLRVSDIHELYYEQCGKPNGKPVIVLHGGPGGGIVDYYRQYFDPSVYRIVLMDQRGAGKSTPHAELKENTTWHLVEDVETLRKHLGIDRWTIVFGGSWGSSLSLAYAQTHPTRVKSLVLRGIFTLRRRELEFFYQEGSSWIFPDAWEKYIEPIPEEERGDMMAAYYKRLTGDDEEEKLKCARAWSVWEMTTSRLFVDPKYIARAVEDDSFAVAFARIECHYFVNHGFLKEGQLIDNAHILKDIPVEIIQGRYDLVCPAKTAWDLHKSLHQSNLVIIPDAGHSAKEPGIVHALVEACDKFRDL
jgi:proline iminopeptidase